jgi:hypothetical protein
MPHIAADGKDGSLTSWIPGALIERKKERNLNYYYYFFFFFWVSGFWFLVSGFWSLVSGLWSLVSGCWLLVSGFLFLGAVCFSLSFVGHIPWPSSIWLLRKRLAKIRKEL